MTMIIGFLCRKSVCNGSYKWITYKKSVSCSFGTTPRLLGHEGGRWIAVHTYYNTTLNHDIKYFQHVDFYVSHGGLLMNSNSLFSKCCIEYIIVKIFNKIELFTHILTISYQKVLRAPFHCFSFF